METTNDNLDEECHNCNGTGEVEVTNFADEPDLTDVEVCIFCNGKGRIPKMKTEKITRACPNCGSTAQLKEDVMIEEGTSYPIHKCGCGWWGDRK
jgi:DnaJ-class molecular chaperone